MKISVITVCYNPGQKMEKTLQSVCMQDYNDVEYIVVDGGSSDGTTELLKKYDDKIAKWVSEPDQGIFDAMAKGVSMATGDFIGFLDSGNWYVNAHVLRDVASRLMPDDDFLSTAYIHEKKNKWKVACPDPELEHLYLAFDVYLHSAFVRRDVFDRFGMPDSSYRCSGDHEFVLRLYTQGAHIRTCDLVTIYYEDGGVSSDPRRIAYREDCKIAQTYGIPQKKAKKVFYKRYFAFTVLVFLRAVHVDSFARRIWGKSPDMGLKELQQHYCNPLMPWFEKEKDNNA